VYPQLVKYDTEDRTVWCEKEAEREGHETLLRESRTSIDRECAYECSGA